MSEKCLEAEFKQNTAEYIDIKLLKVSENWSKFWFECKLCGEECMNIKYFQEHNKEKHSTALEFPGFNRITGLFLQMKGIPSQILFMKGIDQIIIYQLSSF